MAPFHFLAKPAGAACNLATAFPWRDPDALID
jgi:hypothetical protein